MKSIEEVKGRAEECIKSYSLRHAEFFICALILCVAVVFVPKSWSSPRCSLEVSVTEFSTQDRTNYVGASVSEAYKELENDSPFLIFANDAQAVLLETVRKNLCAQGSSKAPVSVEITFVRLEIAASEPEMDIVRAALTGMKGSYGDVTVDKAGRAIKAKIVWNPRRILRDQLTLDGYEFGENVPLLPFAQSEFYEFVKMYSTQVVHTRLWETANTRVAAFKGTVPDDMYGLVIRSGRMELIPFGGVVSWTLRELVNASLPGYSAMTKAAIDQGFESSRPKPLNGVLDALSPEIHSLYRKSDWIGRVWLSRIMSFEPMEHGK